MRLGERLTWRTAALAVVVVGAILAALLALAVTHPRSDPAALAGRGAERGAQAALGAQAAGSVDDFTFDSFSADYWLARAADGGAGSSRPRRSWPGSPSSTITRASCGLCPASTAASTSAPRSST
nr:hypothetical protein GCM10025699_37190 [Microbacterium flavescens]